MSSYTHYPIRLIKPDFDDPLTDLIIDLDRQRRFVLLGSTPPQLFFQLKQLFHLLESIGSARIEGNRTTIAEYLDKSEEQSAQDSAFEEIRNIERTISFLEESIQEDSDSIQIDHRLLREIHRRVTGGLPVSGEGDPTPGEYRQSWVMIAGAEHLPPPEGDVRPLLDELFGFIADIDPPRYDLIKIALAHHRLAWIHPFQNGNGRTVRLFTYAMLLKAGFKVGENNAGTRLLNPTAVFCSDRTRYYDMLSTADSGTDKGLIAWCEYVLQGFKDELDKIARLLDYAELSRSILRPAVQELHRKNGLSNHERDILILTLKKQQIKNRDVQQVLDRLKQVQISRILSSMVEKRLLVPIRNASRIYTIGLVNSPLMREIIRQLDAEGFLPLKNEI